MTPPSNSAMSQAEQIDAGRTGDFLGLPLWGGTVGKFLSLLEAAIAGEIQAARISYLNAHTTNLAFQSVQHRSALKGANLLYADGMAVVWAGRFRGLPVAERVNAADFLPDFALHAAKKKWRVAYVGGEADWPARVVARLQKTAPEFGLVFHHHGYFKQGEEEAALINALAASKPNLVLLGMGSPRQEQLMNRLAADPRLASTSFWCVGALFEYYAGVRRRAPKWMRRLGFEWLIRLVLEPRRLAKRYLIGNVIFITRVLWGRSISP